MGLWDLFCTGLVIAIAAGGAGLSYGYTVGCRDCTPGPNKGDRR